MIFLSVDRLEEGFAVCEGDDRSMVRIPLSSLPTVAEGDCLRQTETGFVIDQEETQRRREYNRALQAKLLRRDKE